MKTLVQILGCITLGILLGHGVRWVAKQTLPDPREYQLEVDNDQIYLWNDDHLVGAISMTDSSRLTELIIEDNK